MGEAILKVFCEPSVIMGWVRFALQDVDVEEGFHAGVPRRSSQRGPGFKKSLTLIHYAAAVFILRCAANEDWRTWQGSNLQPSDS